MLLLYNTNNPAHSQSLLKLRLIHCGCVVALITRSTDDRVHRRTKITVNCGSHHCTTTCDMIMPYRASPHMSPVPKASLTWWVTGEEHVDHPRTKRPSLIDRAPTAVRDIKFSMMHDKPALECKKVVIFGRSNCNGSALPAFLL